VRSSIILLVFASLSAACGQVLFKIGADGRVHAVDFANRYVVLGLGLYGLATAAWIYALSSERLTTAYAFTALTFVFVYAAGVFVLHEKLSVGATAGVLLVLAGVYLIAGRAG
jgi:multidrug transporter EmrE-like cation transporter